MSAVTPEDVVDSASIAAASTRRKPLWQLALHNPSVIFGGVILLIMLTIAALAPVLGTVDPTHIDPVARNKRPDTVLTVHLADGKTAQRTAYFGTDSLGRDIYSRVIYGTRVSLAVGVRLANETVSRACAVSTNAGVTTTTTGVGPGGGAAQPAAMVRTRPVIRQPA